jgi:5'-methylthioadenosine phosphorylase
MHRNADNAARVVRGAIAAMPEERSCACASALQFAVMTRHDAVPAETKEKLGLLIGKYLA